MKATFEDFLADNAVCSSLINNQDAQEVFEILSKDENIIKMIEFSDQNQPALSACIQELEAWHDSKTINSFPFVSSEDKGNFDRTAVGRMVKTILAPFGYDVDSRKVLSQKYGSKYFTSATCYKKKKTASMIIKKIIVESER